VIKAKYLNKLAHVVRDCDISEEARSEIAHDLAQMLVDTNAGFELDRWFRECKVARR
jgi:hypothetical protein